MAAGLSALPPGADRFVTDLSHIPAGLHDEIRAGAALIIEDLPATPATLNWVFVSPALRFGARMPGERLGRYRLGNDVAVQPQARCVHSIHPPGGPGDVPGAERPGKAGAHPRGNPPPATRHGAWTAQQPAIWPWTSATGSTPRKAWRSDRGFTRHCTSSSEIHVRARNVAAQLREVLNVGGWPYHHSRRLGVREWHGA